MPEETRARLLIAQPMMLDGNFDQTVIFMIEHNDDGALGVVLNRPLDLGITDAMPEWSVLAAEPQMVFSGGPVGHGSALALADAVLDDVGGSFTQVMGTIGMVDLASTDDLDKGLVRLRVFSGYSGWGAGQLDAEINQGGWFVVDAEPDDIFTADPSTLWSQVLKRQGGSLARLAFFPPDLGLN